MEILDIGKGGIYRNEFRTSTPTLVVVCFGDKEVAGLDDSILTVLLLDD